MNLLEQLKAAVSSAPAEKQEFEAVVKKKPVDPYFEQTDYVSRSELSAMKVIREKGSYERPPESVFWWGSRFDEYFTEPWNFESSQFNDFEMLQFAKAKAAFIDCFPWLAFDDWHQKGIDEQIDDAKLRGFKTQKAIYREKFDAGNGNFIKAKVKIDMAFADTSIWDIKSTTKQTREAFEKDIVRHGLDIQAAWYVDIAKVKSFSLVVFPYQKAHHVAKAGSGCKTWLKALAAPAQCWYIDMNPFIEQGRAKYQQLVAEAIAAGQIQPL